MTHLSGMDASFLHLETPQKPVRMGSLQIAGLSRGDAGQYGEHAKRSLTGRARRAKGPQRTMALGFGVEEHFHLRALNDVNQRAGARHAGFGIASGLPADASKICQVVVNYPQAPKSARGQPGADTLTW